MDLSAQKQHEQWLQTAVQINESLTAALQQYCLGQNTELAMRAGYKALGMDPRDVTPFGWGLLNGRSPAPASAVASVNTPAAPARRDGSGFWKGLLLGLLLILLLGAGGGGAWLLTRTPSSPPAAAPPGPGQDFDVILERDGKEISRAPIPAK